MDEKKIFERDTHSEDNDSKNPDGSNKNLLIVTATVLQFPIYITHLFLPLCSASDPIIQRQNFEMIEGLGWKRRGGDPPKSIFFFPKCREVQGKGREGSEALNEFD
jgi:hypothetical protein